MTTRGPDPAHPDPPWSEHDIDETIRRQRELDVANDCPPGPRAEPPGEPARAADDPDGP
ncbi:hypothetical protein [Pseudonocardia hydrocarbonoxydans]|uniref:Uncharacterized protein n=1 Tax=Pseudonocardia hydrocarbonoxydans TaxID=76726 RepID=A0A4Y3WRB4_9PSEU|nr:hypothetical protein [Pseudonocardia hydrocarbonoxydans]GEC21385.1 hypothetical protein PHY01_36680 [Pseudonocardia hydrocarbonoxydans]